MEVKSRNSPAAEEVIRSKKGPCFKHKNDSLIPKRRRNTTVLVLVVSQESRPSKISDVAVAVAVAVAESLFIVAVAVVLSGKFVLDLVMLIVG
ncbi:hypothetical protein OIU77_025657 [Salix suchowensis]|uniref:Transmembrane protein n=1 Tax=Salix suchowensis TaxID=1278906 RepID=A0ABQ9BXU2_9ROSI|nr:hypothetical protein OIU77_025657 [Salix suchowensis]